MRDDLTEQWHLNGELHLQWEYNTAGDRQDIPGRKDDIGEGSASGRSLTSLVTADPKLQ